VKIEIRDVRHKVLYRKRFNANDKNSWREVFGIAESFGLSLSFLKKDSEEMRWI